MRGFDPKAHLSKFKPLTCPAQFGATAPGGTSSPLRERKVSKLTPESEVTKPKAVSIAARAIATLIKSQNLTELYRIYRLAKDAGADFNLLAVPPTFTTEGQGILRSRVSGGAVQRGRCHRPCWRTVDEAAGAENAVGRALSNAVSGPISGKRGRARKRFPISYGFHGIPSPLGRRWSEGPDEGLRSQGTSFQVQAPHLSRSIWR